MMTKNNKDDKDDKSDKTVDNNIIKNKLVSHVMEY